MRNGGHLDGDPQLFLPLLLVVLIAHTEELLVDVRFVQGISELLEGQTDQLGRVDALSLAGIQRTWGVKIGRLALAVVEVF
ncbi:MAG: hypothetical protein P4L67_02095 [Candidatus Pacebacteria bacterium]|nr:hypothetical protein [Candidatus Paceibacterota bacterium]